MSHSIEQVGDVLNTPNPRPLAEKKKGPKGPHCLAPKVQRQVHPAFWITPFMASLISLASVP